MTIEINKKPLIINLTTALLLISSLCFGATFYVDSTDGNDNSGGLSSTAAWKTISKVNQSQFQPGDFILFKRGKIWREQLIVKSSGSPGSPITFGAYGVGNGPIISGADILKNWNNFNRTVYFKRNVDVEPEAVFYNDKKILRNKAALTDISANEWDWHSGVLYVNVSEDPDIGLLEAIQRGNGIYGSDTNYITIRDLIIEKTNNAVIENVRGNFWTIESSTIRYGHNRGSGGGIRGVHQTNMVISKNLIENIWADGIYQYNADYVFISDNIIKTCYGPLSDNIHLDASGSIQVLRNILTMYMTDSPKGNLIVQSYGNASGGVVANNKFLYGNYGIAAYSDDLIIKNNWIAHHNTEIWSSGIWLESHTVSNQVISYNVIYDNTQGIGAGGDTEKINIKIYNNTIYDFSNRGVNLEKLCGDIKNNIVWSPDSVGPVLQVNSLVKNCKLDCNYNVLGPEKTGFLISAIFGWKMYNSLLAWQSNELQDSYSTNRDPLFIDTAAENFALKSSSFCIDGGKDLGFSEDFFGNTVPQGQGADIGAVEFNNLRSPRNLRIH